MEGAECRVEGAECRAQGGRRGVDAQQVKSEPAAAVRRVVHGLVRALHALQVQRTLLTVDDHLLSGAALASGSELASESGSRCWRQSRARGPVRRGRLGGAGQGGWVRRGGVGKAG